VSDDKTPQYFEAAYEHQKGGCSVTHLSNREFAWPLKTGKRLADTWPADMTFSMNPERPKDKALIDYISNLEGLLLASPKLVTFLRGQSLPDLEFLPVTILDHKQRVASKDYAIVNSHRVIDCVDQQASDFQWDGLQDRSMVVKRLALKADALGENDRLIRPKFVPGKVLYRADLREALKAQQFTGLGFSRELFGDFNVYW
jgi:hypothetical protein